MATRRDIDFDAGGTRLVGWLILPDGDSDTHPTVVMAQGGSGVREQALPYYADVFAKAGIASLIFDHRGFGASDGEPRQEIEPWLQLGDYRHAITFAQTLPQVRSDRIGIWGTSLSGGHVLVVGAIDKRVRCVVSQIPFVSGLSIAESIDKSDPGRTERIRRACEADRETRFQGRSPGMIPMTTPTADGWGVFVGADAHDALQATLSDAPAWRNEITLRSIEAVFEYEPGWYTAHIASTPLLMIVAMQDTQAPAAPAIEAFERAGEPKRLLTLDTGHFEAYTKGFGKSSRAARDWFVQHLAS